MCLEIKCQLWKRWNTDAVASNFLPIFLSMCVFPNTQEENKQKNGISSFERWKSRNVCVRQDKNMVNPRNKLQHLPLNTPCSWIDYLIMFLPQESSHSPTASWETPSYSVLAALNSSFSLFWVCCAGQAVLGWMLCTRTRWDFIAV